MFKYIKYFLFFALLLRNLMFYCDDIMVCTLSGTGKDPIYDIAASTGETTEFEVPIGVKIHKILIDRQGDWLFTAKENLVFIQPLKEKLETVMTIIAVFNEKTLIFMFRLIAQERSHYDHHIKIIIGDFR